MGTFGVEEPGTWGPTWRGGAPGFPWCQYLRPSAGSWSLLPVRPGHSAGSGGEKRGGGGRSSAVLFIAQSLRVGASGTKPLPTPMRTHISQKRKKKKKPRASNLDFPFLTHLPQPQQT